MRKSMFTAMLAIIAVYMMFVMPDASYAAGRGGGKTTAKAPANKNSKSSAKAKSNAKSDSKSTSQGNRESDTGSKGY